VLQELNPDYERATDVDSLTSLIWLTLGAFAIGTEGFMIAGLLPALARDLKVGVPAAGHLVTAFSLAYAVGAPRVLPHPWKTLGLHTRCHPSGRKSLHHYGHDGSFLPSKPRRAHILQTLSPLCPLAISAFTPWRPFSIRSVFW
jgi:hypothetical protein